MPRYGECCPHCGMPLNLTAELHCDRRPATVTASGMKIQQTGSRCNWLTCARKLNGCGAVIDRRGYHTHEQARGIACAQEKADQT